MASLPTLPLPGLTARGTVRSAPGTRDFALLFSLESAVRGTLLSAVPLLMLRLWETGTAVSAIYLGVGILSLTAGFLTPALAARIGRRRVTLGAAGAYLLGMVLLVAGHPMTAVVALLVNACATAALWVCLSAYVLDGVPREALGRAESQRLLYSAAAWTLGPVTGVMLLDWWQPAPFLLAGAFAALLVAAFVRLDPGEGRGRVQSAGFAPAYLRRFLRQPRLVAGWTFATIRSAGWWIYIVYLPLFCRETGLDERLGGAAVSLSSLLLFATPLLLRLMRRLTVRGAVRGAFGLCAALFLGAFVLSPWPWATLLCLVLASGALVMLDVCGSLPFLMAVRPGERTEMAAVYASFRDVSGIVTPAIGGLVLLALPVAATFAAAGLAMAGAWALAATVHPRLGERRSAPA